MAFDPQLAADEKVEHDIFLVISKKPQIRLVLTNHAAYWPGKKAFAVSDPITTVRVTPDQIQEVFVGRKSAAGSIAGGLAMALVGLAWTFANYPESYWVGYPQALIVGGIGVSVFGGRRLVLRIQSANERLHWVAPITFGAAVKDSITGVFTSVGEWCKRHSLNVKVGSTKKGNP